MRAAPTIDLYRTETAHYRDNLAIGRAVALGGAAARPSGEPPYARRTVTADPAEGEA